jgi:hypothetical protein
MWFNRYIIDSPEIRETIITSEKRIVELEKEIRQIKQIIKDLLDGSINLKGTGDDM